ncbi:MAG TPA: sulfotransferase [Rhizomicrobium sp.]
MSAASPESTRPSGQLQQYLRDVGALLRAGDRQRAIRLSAQAVASGHEHINLLTLAAYEHLGSGRTEAALACASRARELGPRDVDALNVLGLCLVAADRGRGALPIYDAALRQAPNAAHVHYNKGRALEDLNETAHARIAYERTIALQPAHSQALTRLATFAALRGDAITARSYAQRALQLDPGSSAAELALAMADIEEKRFDNAMTRLVPLTRSENPSARNRAIALSLLGDALDGLDRVTEAFSAYSASNALLRTIHQPIYGAQDMETAAERVSRMVGYFHDNPPKPDMLAPGGTSPVGIHVFLIGFPRSGTTLLEQILDAHPDVETMTERDCLIDAANEFLLPGDGLQRLATLHDTERKKYRQAYWRRVAEYGHTASRPVFIDKMPLNTVLLCLIARLFPDAKILFALRDPRDVVLSCFRRRFGFTAQMFELLTLEGAARYYDLVRQLGEICAPLFGEKLHYLRYEDMVRDFEGESGKTCAFLGISPHRSMSEFATRVRAKDINTPSAGQVARGLYTEGVGQWRRYAQQLQPVLPVLAPWMARFGYGGP